VAVAVAAEPWFMPISITSPEAAIAATPYLIGFTPTDSMVLLLSAREGRSLALRVDLPSRPEIAWLQSIVNGIKDPVPPTTMLLAYADSASEELVAQLSAWLTNVLSPLTDVAASLLVGRDSARSLAPGISGTLAQEIDMRDVRDHPIVAQCVAQGMTCLSGRHELVAQLQPVLDEFSSRVLEHLRRSESPGVERSQDALERRAVEVLQGRENLSPSDVACLALACRDCHVRDPLLAIVLSPQSLLTQPLRGIRTRLLHAVRHLPDTHAGPVAATLALAAWADGDGASALVAAERAMDLDPRNTLAPLIADALSHGLPPDTWTTLTDGIPIEVLRGHGRRSA
jgi:hypothetical protein